MTDGPAGPIGCGICSAAGTLIPKLITGKFGELLQPGAGVVSLMGVAVSIAGIVLVGLAMAALFFWKA